MPTRGFGDVVDVGHRVDERRIGADGITSGVSTVATKPVLELSRRFWFEVFTRRIRMLLSPLQRLGVEIETEIAARGQIVTGPRRVEAGADGGWSTPVLMSIV